jgi:hypothetical protein
MEHEKGTEPAIIEMIGDRFLHVFDARYRRTLASVHAWDILGQAVVVDQRRDPCGIRVAKQVLQISLDLIPVGHASLEVRATVHALGEQDPRDRNDGSSQQAIAEHEVNESFLGRTLDEDKQALHG